MAYSEGKWQHNMWIEAESSCINVTHNRCIALARAIVTNDVAITVNSTTSQIDIIITQRPFLRTHVNRPQIVSKSMDRCLNTKTYFFFVREIYHRNLTTSISIAIRITSDFFHESLTDFIVAWCKITVADVTENCGWSSIIASQSALYCTMTVEYSETCLERPPL